MASKDVANFFYSHYSSKIKVDDEHVDDAPPTKRPITSDLPVPTVTPIAAPMSMTMPMSMPMQNAMPTTDIRCTIHIDLIESYKGCIREKTISRKKIINNSIATIESEIVCIEIHQGILNNETITIENKGDEHILHNGLYETGKSIGNLIITVEIENRLPITSLIQMSDVKSLNLCESDYYEKKGNDLVFVKTITLKEALCGYIFSVPHLNKNVYKVNSLDVIVYPGKTQTIPSNGFIRNNKIGNLIITYDVVFPVHLTDEQKQGLEQLL